MEKGIYWTPKARVIVDKLMELGGERIELTPDGLDTIVTFHITGLLEEITEEDIIKIMEKKSNNINYMLHHTE